MVKKSSCDIIFKMKIKKLKLKNFRSYSDKVFEFDDKLNVLVGQNAQGKTNVLEAIFYAVIGKSFKTGKEKDLIKWKKDSASIEADFFNGYRADGTPHVPLNRDKIIKKNEYCNTLPPQAFKKSGRMVAVWE